MLARLTFAVAIAAVVLTALPSAAAVSAQGPAPLPAAAVSAPDRQPLPSAAAVSAQGHEPLPSAAAVSAPERDSLLSAAAVSAQDRKPLPSTTKVAAQGRESLPLPYAGGALQVVTVVADGPTATTAMLTAWQRSGPSSDDWTVAYGPFKAFVGSDGVGQASETTSKTPAGVWPLTEAFGIQANNGTRLPYRQVGTSDWWVSDVKSPLYNTYYHCDPGTCPFDESAGEDLGKAGPVYDHAVVIDYNRTPAVPGAGSAFFLHVSNGMPTAGCVAIPAGDLNAVMAWLDPAKHPVTEIGVR